MSEFWDVALVGCGPVGAFAANLLGTCGLRTLVLEARTDPHGQPRAMHLDHEMLRLLDSAGVLGSIQGVLRAGDGHVHIGADGGVIRYLGSAGQPRPYSFANDYFFFQPELEHALRSGLGRFPNVQLQLGAQVTAAHQSDDEVTLTVVQGERVSRVAARYVIGCDGASSVVRKSLGIGLQDLRFDEPWLVVDAEVEGPIRFPHFKGLPESADIQRLSVMLCDPNRPATLVPGRGVHRRWEFMLLPGESPEQMNRTEVVAELLKPWLQDVPYRIVRAATYRFHGLLARRWRIGRVFLAGDAAHQSPPFFGQGMCHGMRDAANLAWKLELVCKGHAREELLNTYQVERAQQVRQVVDAAIDAGRYICELDSDRARLRDEKMRAAQLPSSAATAADLIPPLSRGVLAEVGSVDTGVGTRFIQPMVRSSNGSLQRLDQVTGRGWVMIGHSEFTEGCLSPAARAIWGHLGGKSFAIGTHLEEPEGCLGRWLETHRAKVVIVRPDFYTFGVHSTGDGASALLHLLARRLHLTSLPTWGAREVAQY